MDNDMNYDVIVVGGGHAGCEAALASARIGARTLMINSYIDNTALMPCNPSIGGPAKGHLVRELSALGGEQARAADASTLLVRWLNTSKGVAVRALRAQCDPYVYAGHYLKAIQTTAGLYVHQDEVEEILFSGGSVSGVRTRLGLRYEAKAVVICCGTYMRGAVYIGDKTWPSGPLGQVGTSALSASLERAGMKLVRMRTDTTPRLKLSSIDTSQLTRQKGADDVCFDIWRESRNAVPQSERDAYACWYAHSTPETYEIIKSNLHRSPLRTGLLTSKGPRYCPSIEDKVMKFPDRICHPMFFEPISSRTREVYVQNFSTSMPYDVQERMIHSLPGCARAEIIRPGYGIEYDALRPGQLSATLETRLDGMPCGLYAAGQINCTSGYEEAGAQGFAAGVNAALAALGRKDEQMILGRSEAYLGVLIDDLTTKETDEPYRMLTSRCEHRLLMRHDNAARRLSPLGHRLGLIDDAHWSELTARFAREDDEIERVRNTRISPSDALNAELRSAGAVELRDTVALDELLCRQNVTYSLIVKFSPRERALSPDEAAYVETEVRYAGYIARQERMADRLTRMDNVRIPDDFDVEGERGLLLETRQKLKAFKPRTLGQALRISGVTPTDVQLLSVAIESRRSNRDECPHDE